jgi:ABC-type uncharacterized transport system fused permease/ATPase subunit
MLEKERLGYLLEDPSLDHITSVKVARTYLKQGLTELAYKILTKDITSFYTNNQALYRLLTGTTNALDGDNK